MMRCLSHCATCGAHFRTTELFEAHLEREHDERDCVACGSGVEHAYTHLARPSVRASRGTPVLIDGTCDLMDLPGTFEVRVWVAEPTERERERRGKLHAGRVREGP